MVRAAAGAGEEVEAAAGAGVGAFGQVERTGAEVREGQRTGDRCAVHPRLADARAARGDQHVDAVHIGAGRVADVPAALIRGSGQRVRSWKTAYFSDAIKSM